MSLMKKVSELILRDTKKIQDKNSFTQMPTLQLFHRLINVQNETINIIVNDHSWFTSGTRPDIFIMVTR